MNRHQQYEQNPHYKMFEIDSRLRYFKPHTARMEKTFAQEVIQGINREYNSKFINPKFFYDEIGSKLFEDICSTQEYYLTRVETALLEEIKYELGSLILKESDEDTTNNDDDKIKNIRLVELGSGASIKTRIILDSLQNIQSSTEYVPIDISDILAQSSEQLLADYAHLNITGVIDTYEGGLEFLSTYNKGPNLIIFLGSSYGNLSPADGIVFLRKIRAAMKPGDLFLMGLDMVKDASILESAYNDAAGVTSRFNLNILSRINSELDADFNLDNFEHQAKYNYKKQRMEMHLKSLCEQNVIMSNPGIELHLMQDEMIHTENSHKYKTHQIQKMLDESGFKQLKMWTDKNKYFTIVIAGVANTTTDDY